MRLWLISGLLLLMDLLRSAVDGGLRVLLPLLVAVAGSVDLVVGLWVVLLLILVFARLLTTLVLFVGCIVLLLVFLRLSERILLLAPWVV